MLTLDQIVRLMDEVAERDLGGIEIERAGFRLRIDGRPLAPVLHNPTAVSPVLASAEALSPGSVQNHGAASTNSSGGDQPSPDVHVINSPIVGTFFKAPAPEADPFVRVGDRVAKGQIICIVEAMKLMNEIEADEDGEVVEVYAKNGEPVDFGAPLFALKVSKDSP